MSKLLAVTLLVKSENGNFTMEHHQADFPSNLVDPCDDGSERAVVVTVNYVEDETVVAVLRIARFLGCSSFSASFGMNNKFVFNVPACVSASEVKKNLEVVLDAGDAIEYFKR